MKTKALSCRRSSTFSLIMMTMAAAVIMLMLMLSSSSVVTCYTLLLHQPQRRRLVLAPMMFQNTFQQRQRHSSSSPSLTRVWSESSDSSPGAPNDVEVDDDDEVYDAATTTTTGDIDPMAVKLKDEILNLATRTKRGFQASKNDRQRAKELITQLAKYNPTSNPASPYYDNAADSSSTTSSTTLSGKWTLIYTDAPDITSLDTSKNPFATAILGKIGQECNPPYIKNVIEWKRPEWATNLPFSGKKSGSVGDDEPRILQKVVTSASANPKNPYKVDLKVAGFELMVGDNELLEGNTSSDDITSRIETLGLLPGLLSLNPIDIKGPLNPPFGQFEILYLDDNFRIIRTYQGYYAINQRITSPKDEWF